MGELVRFGKVRKSPGGVGVWIQWIVTGLEVRMLPCAGVEIVTVGGGTITRTVTSSAALSVLPSLTTRRAT